MAENSEHSQALAIANRWLDFKMNALTQIVPGNPDCDACVLARQFIRTEELTLQLRERLEHVIAWLRAQANAEKTPDARKTFIEAHNVALAIKEGRYDDG
jgi:hypothetical protein